MTKHERFLIDRANHEFDKPQTPAKNPLNLNESEHAKKEGQYEAYLIGQAYRALALENLKRVK